MLCASMFDKSIYSSLILSVGKIPNGHLIENSPQLNKNIQLNGHYNFLIENDYKAIKWALSLI
jgi:hypothetical protein